MHQASVGFHCPNCAAKGKQRVVTGRAAFGAAFVPAVTYGLIAVNVAVWLLTAAAGQDRTIYDFGAAGGFIAENGEWYRVVTSAFLHAGIIHLAFNMFALFNIGPVVERTLGRLSYANSQHLATLGALTDYDRHKEDAEKKLPWERLEGRYGWREARLSRRSPSQHRWFLDQLVAVRDEERTRLGTVSRVSMSADGELDVSLKLWPGAPKSRAMRPFTTSFSEDPPIPTILLGETQEEPATLIVPPRTFTPGRTLRSMDPGPERTYKLTRLAQRGADFERVAFEES